MWVKSLNRVLEKSKISISDLSKVLETSSQYCSRLLSGDSSPPSSEKILKLVSFLENKKLLSEEEILVFLQDIIRDKLGDSEKILLSELESRLFAFFSTDDSRLKSFYESYFHSVLISHNVIHILQGLQYLPRDQHHYIRFFLDYVINKDKVVLDKLVSFLSSDI